MSMSDRSGDWFSQALRNLDQAVESAAAERHEGACFAAQQAAEMAVKAGHLKRGQDGSLEPNIIRCKTVTIECIDIAIIPGLAFDEKGGRIGSGKGYYDRLIPRLAITTRKVALTLEEQIVPQIPMESHDKYVDIIITDKRIIYKI